MPSKTVKAADEVSSAIALADLIEALNRSTEQAHEVGRPAGAFRARLVEFEIELACAVVASPASKETREPPHVSVVIGAAELSKLSERALSRMKFTVALEPVRAGQQQRQPGPAPS